MKRYLFVILLMPFIISIRCKAQNFPSQKIDLRITQKDSMNVIPSKPWTAASEVFSINMFVWGFNHFIANEDFARINIHSIKHNLKTFPVWDTDKFSTNLVAHPYHGSLYFNAARSNGMSFWQSIPYSFGGSLMWEFFMENERPSINDLLATTIGGTELGEITFRLSDLLLDNRATGSDRIRREILAGMISPIRAINRLITGEAWKHSATSGKVFRDVPVDFLIGIGPRFLAEQENTKKGEFSANLSVLLNYGNPFDDDYYSPYEWFRLSAGIDLFSNQPVITDVNAVAALWGKNVWDKEARSLSVGLFQHFNYYDSQIKTEEGKIVSPYRISEAAAIGGGVIYHRKAQPSDQMDVYAEYYVTGVALGASKSDYFMVDERDYNLGSGYSAKAFTGLLYKKQWGLMLNLENYHIFTWKGYDPDLDLSTVDFNKLNTQGDAGDARLAVFTSKLVYFSPKKWNISLSNRYFSRRTHYKYREDIDYSTYDISLSLGIVI